MASTSTACLRFPFLPARTRSAAAAASSSSPRCPSLKCISATNDISLSPASPPRAPVAGGVNINGLPGPPAPVPASRDPHWLPRPLTSADLMEATGEGLKVAYQGFPGAYSEAGAKKAYPNCQTLPCEHFDTAFQDRNYVLSFHLEQAKQQNSISGRCNPDVF